ncbi:hypothetical protein Tco_1088301 [Tanacetum coccineum]
MTTPRTPVMLRARIYIPFIILSDNEDEDTTLPVRSASLSPDYVLALPDYSLNFDSNFEPVGDDSPNVDRTEAAESLHTQTDLTPIPLPSSTASPPSPPPLLLPSSSCKRYRSPLPPPPPPPVAVPPPPPENIKSVGDNIETLRARLGSSHQEIVALRARVETLEQQDRVTRDSLRIARGRITRLQLRAVAAEQQATDLQDSQRAEMTGQDVEALDAWAEAIEQRAEALQISLGATQIDITDLLESRRDDRLEMAEL